MSRSGYTEDIYENWALIRWRGAVTSALRGKRGQEFLKEMLEALDALPNKRLITEELERDGDFCALGAVGHSRGISMSLVDPFDHESVAIFFGIAHALACEIMWVNDDEFFEIETPEKRFERVRKWIVGKVDEP